MHGVGQALTLEPDSGGVDSEKFGDAGRRYVQAAHSYDGLAGRLILAYQTIAERQGRRDILAALAGLRLVADGRPSVTVSTSALTRTSSASSPSASTC